LLIGPPATALRLTRTVRSAMVVASVLGIATTWLGILLAYDSFYWIPSNKALPVSFFIVAIAFVLYLVSGLPMVRRHVGRRRELQFTRDSGQSTQLGPAGQAA
jgi:zinc/manganese transport system permease protein